MKKKPYQDIWRDGQLVQRGRRECEHRYEAIRSVLERELGRGFSVADVGGWDGYFSVRLAEDLDARSLNVDKRNTPLPVPYMRLQVTAGNVGQIGEHDAVLLLSVLHHMEDWQSVYEQLREQCLLLIVEVCNPEEATGNGRVIRETAHRMAPQYERVSADAAEKITESPSIDEPELKRPVYLIRCAARGTVEQGSGKAAPLMEEEDFSALGYEPYPGTLNVRVGQRVRDWLQNLPGVEGPGLKRSTHYVPVQVEGQRCHVHFSRSRATVELVAPVNLREALNVTDDDTITLRPCE